MLFAGMIHVFEAYLLSDMKSLDRCSWFSALICTGGYFAISWPICWKRITLRIRPKNLDSVL